MARAVVCLATYNERHNLESMVHALAEVLDPPFDRVVVIDDSSPDGTGRIAERLAADLPWVHVLHRPRKDGLGSAYVAGIRWASEHLPDLVLTMDCDFSHDPRDVPRLIEAAADADLVLGSRYVPGGRNDCGSLARRVLSRGGCLYAQALLSLSIRDLTGGFKCFRRSTLEAIDLENVTMRGYGFHIETTYRTVRAGLRVREIPIRFSERRSGVSKMTRDVVIEAACKVPALRGRALLERGDRTSLARAAVRRP